MDLPRVLPSKMRLTRSSCELVVLTEDGVTVAGPGPTDVLIGEGDVIYANCVGNDGSAIFASE